MVQNGQEVRHHEVDRTLTDRDKATRQWAIGIGHCIGQYRPDKRSPLDKSCISEKRRGRRKGKEQRAMGLESHRCAGIMEFSRRNYRKGRLPPNLRLSSFSHNPHLVHKIK